MAGALSVVSLRFPWIHTPASFKATLRPLQDDPAGGATNLWGYIDTRDVARACQLALEAGISGHEAYYISARNTFMKTDTCSSRPGLLPGSQVKIDAGGQCVAL